MHLLASLTDVFVGNILNLSPQCRVGCAQVSFGINTGVSKVERKLQIKIAGQRLRFFLVCTSYGVRAARQFFGDSSRFC